MVEIRSSRRRKAITKLPHDILMTLPRDILMYHILLRLPNKSLICCMCVSKQWQSFLKSHTFANVHLYRVTNDDHQNHHKLLLFRLPSSCEFSTIDCEAPDEGVTVCRLPPFKINSIYMWILSSCNGLVWVGLKDNHGDVYKFSDLVLWNPLTSEYKKLSKSTSSKNCYDVRIIAFELYYNSSDDDYRLLHVSDRRDVNIYSMKSASWRKIDAFQRVASYSEKWHRSTCLKENLYFLRIKYRDKVIRSLTSPFSIIRFDTKSEKFSEIETPSSFRDVWCSSLMAQKGCIHLCVKTKTGIELWKMNEDEVWMKMSTVSDVQYNLQPQYLMRNGNWIMTDTGSSNNKGHLYEVVLKNKYGKGEKRLYDYGFKYQTNYIETFVSPKHYMK